MHPTHSGRMATFMAQQTNTYRHRNIMDSDAYAPPFPIDSTSSMRGGIRQDPPASVPMPGAVQADHSAISITVRYKKRSVTLEVAPGVIVAELIPDAARRLGVLDPAIVYGGYHLINGTGEPLDPARTIPEQQEAIREPYTLVPRALADSEPVYDDIVEAVGANVARIYRAWTTDHTMLTTLIICLGMLAVSAACLALIAATPASVAIGAAFTVILVALTSLLDNHKLQAQAIAMGLMASAFAALTGFKLVQTMQPLAPAYGLPMLGAAMGTLATGAIVFLIAARTRPYSLIPVIVAAVLLIPSAFSAALPPSTTTVWVITSAITALVVNALPWMCLSMARIGVNSPQTEAEIFALPEPINPDDVAKRYVRGSTYLFIARAAVCTTLVICTPCIAGIGKPFAPLLSLFAFAAILLDSRQIYTLREMVVTVGIAGLGMLLTLLLFAMKQPQARPALAIGLLLCAIVGLVCTYVSRVQSLFVTRVLDAVEVACTLALPPLAYFIIL